MAIKIGGILFVINIILALYFFNIGLNLIVLPEIFNSATQWINIAGGILLIIGGFFSMRALSSRHTLVQR